MNATKRDIIDEGIHIEGGYVNEAADPVNAVFPNLPDLSSDDL